MTPEGLYGYHLKERDDERRSRVNLVALCPNHHAVAHALFGHKDPQLDKAGLIARLREVDAA